MGHIYDDVRTLVAGLRSLSVGCIKQSANFVAHCLARYASQLGEELVWLEESPAQALDALYLDASSLNDWMNSRFAFKKKKKLSTTRTSSFILKNSGNHTHI